MNYILDVLCTAGLVLLVLYVISLIKKDTTFSPDWRWIVWIPVIATIADVASAKKKKGKR